MSNGRVDQTSRDGILRDHRDRIRALEAVPATLGITEITSIDNSIVVTNPDGPTVDLAVNQIQSWAYDNAITIPPSGGGGGTLIDWNNNPGGTMIDFSTLNTPKFNFDGLVIVTMTVEAALPSGDPAWGAGTQLLVDYQTPVSGLYPEGTTLVVASKVDASNYPPTINACAGGIAGSGRDMQLVITNTDSIDHLVTWLVKFQQIVGI